MKKQLFLPVMLLLTLSVAPVAAMENPFGGEIEAPVAEVAQTVGSGLTLEAAKEFGSTVIASVQDGDAKTIAAVTAAAAVATYGAYRAVKGLYGWFSKPSKAQIAAVTAKDEAKATKRNMKK